MNCRDCPALQFDPHKRKPTCRCTGAQVRTTSYASAMPLLSLKDSEHVWADGDDNRASCPATLDREIVNAEGRALALSILRQIAEHAELEFCLSLYPDKTADKLRALMLGERIRLMNIQKATV